MNDIIAELRRTGDATDIGGMFFCDMCCSARKTRNSIIFVFKTLIL